MAHRELKISPDYTYVDTQGDFWYRHPTEKREHNFTCAYLLDGEVTSVDFSLTYISKDLAIDETDDGCHFTSLE